MERQEQPEYKIETRETSDGVEVRFPPELVERFSDDEWRKLRKQICEDLGIKETDLIEKNT